MTLVMANNNLHSANNGVAGKGTRGQDRTGHTPPNLQIKIQNTKFWYVPPSPGGSELTRIKTPTSGLLNSTTTTVNKNQLDELPLVLIRLHCP